MLQCSDTFEKVSQNPQILLAQPFLKVAFLAQPF
jgi:hypothetical protein